MLSSRLKYLQVALNRPLSESLFMIQSLPRDRRILIEVGTPLLKRSGAKSIRLFRDIIGEEGYIVADTKCMDRGAREVNISATAGASAATCLALAPIETIEEFIEKCRAYNIDSMLDMLNVEFPFEILQKLRQKPDIIVLHRGVDERYQKEIPQIPYHQITRIKGTYNVFISIAGGEDFKDVKRAIFNGADIAIVWEKFFQNPQQMQILATKFLKQIR